MLSGNGSTPQPPGKTRALSGGVPLDIGPVDIAAATFVSDHRISVFALEDDLKTPKYEYDFSAHVTVDSVLAHTPKSVWSIPSALKPNLQTINSQPATVAGSLVGFTLTGNILDPDFTPRIAVQTLSREIARVSPAFSWAGLWPHTDTCAPFDQTQAWADLSRIDQAVSKPRSEILAVLAAQGLDIDTQVNVAALASSAREVLLAPPVLSCLGEQQRLGG